MPCAIVLLAASLMRRLTWSLLHLLVCFTHPSQCYSMITTELLITKSWIHGTFEKQRRCRDFTQGTSTWPGVCVQPRDKHLARCMCVQPWLHIEHAFEAENAEQVAGARRSLKDSPENWESHSADRAAQKGQLEQWWVLAQGKEQEHPLQPTRGVSNSGGVAQGV